MAGVVFKDGTILTAATLNAAMDQKADVMNPNFAGVVAIPSGPTGQRPATPAQFSFRGNSDTGLPEVYIGGAWVTLNLTSQGNAPSPPSPVIIGSVSSSAVPLTWGASSGSGSIKYQVQYQIAGATGWTNWGGPVAALSATVTGLQPATNYNFQVIASNGYGSNPSATVSTKTLGVAPDAPTNLTLSSITSQSVQLTWNGSTIGTPPIAYQAAYQKVGGSGFTPFGTAISGTTEVITGLQPGTGYLFQVTAQNSGGSTVSSSVSGTTMNASGVAPNAPTNLAVSGTVGQNSLTLTWTAPSVGSDIIYSAYAKASNATSYSPLGTPTTATNKAVTGLNPGTTYSIYVVASNSAGSAQTNAISVITATFAPGNTGQTWGLQYSSLSAPILSGPVAGQVATSQALQIRNLAINDPPAGGNAGNCSLTISCNKSAGTVSSIDSSGNPVSGSGTGTINGYLGSLSSITQVLRSLVYTAPTSAMSDVITIKFTDPFSNTTQISVPITVVAGVAPSTSWGKSSLPGPGTISTDSTGTTARRVQDILGNLGVNTHIDKYPSPYYGNLSAIENALNYVGVVLLKDSPDPSNAASNTTWLPQIKNNVQLVAPLAYWLQIANGPADGYQPQLDLFVQMAASGYVVAFEGVGGADFTPGGVPAAEQFQPTLYSAAKSAGIKAVTFDVSTNIDPSSIPSQASVADFGSLGFNPVDAPFDGAFGNGYAAAAQITPGRPIVLENFGWQSFPEGGSAQGQQNFASENVVAAYMLNCIFDAVLLGFTAFFWAALADDPDDFGGPTTYGWFDNSWNPKPAATAIRNMNLLLMDQGVSAFTFTPGKMQYGTSVAQAGVDQLGLHTLLLQRSDGAFFLAMWNEQVLQDLANYPDQTNAEITVDPINVTLSLTTAATSIAVYDPMVGTSPVKTGSGTSINVAVPAHVIFVEIVRP